MRVVGRLLLLWLGFTAGLMAAAAVVKRAVPSVGDVESDDLRLVAVLDGVDLKSRAGAFRGGSALAWFGGVALDLREATPAPEMHLSTHALFGGVALRVPPGWRVESSVRAIGGGVNVGGEDPDDPDAPLLVVDGLALFGGVALGRKAAAE